MLYEVITDEALFRHRIFDVGAVEAGLERVAIPPEVRRDLTRADAVLDVVRGVITSYSIHYTKLYESELRNWGDVRRSERCDEVLEEIGLADIADRPAGTLAHGQKQWLEIGMLLMQNPAVLLVDESYNFV